MKKLVPPLESYSASDIASAQKVFHPLERYLRIIATPKVSSWHACRHLVWSEAALATFHRTATTEAICRHWSLFANELVSSFATKVFSEESGAVFAFGKLGAEELNLSSDIDLLIVSNNEFNLVSQGRLLQTEISSTTEFGFLFRVDYELRPGGKTSPLAPTLDQVLDYYGNYGEVWERMAFIRLRPLFGNKEIIQQIEEFRNKFCFRKHLDFGLLEDLNSLRNKVQASARSRAKSDVIDLKLGPGGIRDIELFCHALQIIHGGKNSLFRSRSTTESLRFFQDQQVLPSTDFSFLSQLYWQLRHWENYNQAIDDQQIYQIHKSILDVQNWNQLHESMQKCSDIVANVLGSIRRETSTLSTDLEEQKVWLQTKGFSQTEIDQHWDSISSIPILSRQRERDSQFRNQFLYSILDRMGERHLVPNRLQFLSEFLTSVRAKTSFFTLLLQNEKLLDLLAKIFCTSPQLSRVLISRPEILDSLVMRNLDSIESAEDDGDFFQRLFDFKQLTEFLAGADFLLHQDINSLGKTLSETADEVIKKLFARLIKEHPIENMEILCLGKWGGNELGLLSDLDCVFVKYSATEERDGKFVRRFFNRLTEQHSGGSLYNIDTRLRTTEQQGLLITTLDSTTKYFSEKAQPWERQAYLKTRSLFRSKSTDLIRSAIIERPLKPEEISGLNDIRLSLLKNVRSDLDLKYLEGGLLDTELAVQTKILHEQIKINSGNCLEMAQQIGSPTLLMKNYQFMRLVEQLHRMVSVSSNLSLKRESEAFDIVSTLLNSESKHLEDQLRSALQTQVELLKNLDPRRCTQ